MATPNNNNANRGRRNNRGPVKKEPEHQINENIQAPVVRVVREGVEPVIMNTPDAIKMAYDEGLDLVMISPTATPPVCRIIEYQKFLYDLKKKNKEMKANAAKTTVKEIRFNSLIGEHDFDFKVRHAIEFLQDGNKVKLELFLKGRQVRFFDKAQEMMNKFVDALMDYGKVESSTSDKNDSGLVKRMHVIISPKKNNEKSNN